MRRALTTVLAVLVALAALLVAAQLMLPGVAEDRLREDLADSGDVRSVQVRAFPAVKLLFNRADRVIVRLGQARAQPGRFADLVASTRETDRLDASATGMRVGPLAVGDLRMRKNGDRLEGEASVTAAALSDALPFNVGVRPIIGADGSLVLEASAGVLGTQVAVRAQLSAREGNLVISPEGLLGGFATVTVFSDPRVEVRDIGAREEPGGYTFTAVARLR